MTQTTPALLSPQHKSLDELLNAIMNMTDDVLAGAGTNVVISRGIRPAAHKSSSMIADEIATQT